MERRIRGKDSEMKGIVNLMLPYLRRTAGLIFLKVLLTSITAVAYGEMWK